MLVKWLDAISCSIFQAVFILDFLVIWRVLFCSRNYKVSVSWIHRHLIDLLLKI